MIWQVARTMAFLIGALGVVVIAAFVAIYLPGLHHKLSPAGPLASDFSRTDFITIVLTSIAVILGALAIVLAAAGAIGYVTVRSAAEVAAKSRAEEVAGKVADEVAKKVAEAVATRVAAELGRQLAQGAMVDSGEAFAEAEGKE